MNKIFHPLLALIASATDKELAKYLEYLKHENKILRARLPKQVHTTHEERQTLLKYGKVIGRAIEELITIVSPATFYRWVRAEKDNKPKPKNPKGGQRKPQELRELVLSIAKETGFGLARIIGELRKLGITGISRQTVRNILKSECRVRNGFHQGSFYGCTTPRATSHGPNRLVTCRRPWSKRWYRFHGDPDKTDMIQTLLCENEAKTSWSASSGGRTPGRPRIRQEIVDCIEVRAGEPRWGCDRLVGALAGVGYIISPGHHANLLLISLRAAPQLPSPMLPSSCSVPNSCASEFFHLTGYNSSTSTSMTQASSSSSGPC